MTRMAQTRQRSAAAPAPDEHADDRAPREQSGHRHLERAPSLVVTAVILVLIASATVRLYELQRPNVLVFDEVYYAKDAHTILDGYLGPEQAYPWEPGNEISWPHPEYGKFAIALGEAPFGNTSFGWRIVPAIAGTILLALVYPIGRRLGLAPVWALLGLILAASDFLGIVQSRIATLDVFVGLWSVLCIYLALRYVQTGHRLRLLFLCGLAGGLALGTKWSGAYAILVAAAIMLLYRRPGVSLSQRWRPLAVAGAFVVAGAVLVALGARVPHPFVLVGYLFVLAGVVIAEVTIPNLRFPSLALVVLPVALYVASYTVYFVKGHHTLGQWWELQHQMWWFNEHLHATHTYMSKAWTWIIDYRPVWYYWEQSHGTVHGIISIGNPLLWWASLPALVALVVLAIVRRDKTLLLPPLIVALLYLPWFPVSRTSFMYYMTPVAPFMALAVAMALREISRARLPRLQWGLLCYGAATAVAALLWYQIGHLANWWFWQEPHHVSAAFAWVVVVVALAVLLVGIVAFVLWPRSREVWPYLTWAYAGAVTGICLAFLPILIDLSIPTAHFYHLMWFGNWI